MTNRVLLGSTVGGAYGLRVSRPGGNVLDPNLPPTQVAFDSSWLTSARLHKVETVALPSTTATTPEYATFYYGVDFGVLPPVFAFWVHGNKLIPLALGMMGTTDDWSAPESYIRVWSDRVDFRRWHPNWTQRQAVRYFVLRPV